MSQLTPFSDTHLAQIKKALGSHSVFAPSGSAMWLTCSGSLVPNLLETDNAGRDAAEGTVAHEVGEHWLTNVVSRLPFSTGSDSIDKLVEFYRPRDLIGVVRDVVEGDGEVFEITITEEMLHYVGEYVSWCAHLPGKHFVETKVFFSDLTPLDSQGGTADHAACASGKLVITDLKYGKGEQVFAAVDINNPLSLVPEYEGGFNGNPQAMLYALGFYYLWNEKYKFKEVEIRIAQPRLDHFESWTTTVEELLRFAEFVKVRAHDAWAVDAPRTPSKKGCRWCKVKKTCGALAAWLETAVDDVFDPVSDEVIETTWKVIDSKDVATYKDALENQGTRLAHPKPVAEMSTEHMAKLLPYRKVIEDWFGEMELELERRAIQDGEEIPGHKLVEGRIGNRKFLPEEEVVADILANTDLTEEDLYERVFKSPPQIADVIRARHKLTKKAADQLISDLVTRAPGRKTLVSIEDKREGLEDVGSVFDAVEDADI